MIRQESVACTSPRAVLIYNPCCLINKIREVNMEKRTLKEKRLQIKKWYLMTNTPVPDYLIEENHICDPDAYEVDLEACPASKN